MFTLNVCVCVCFCPGRRVLAWCPNTRVSSCPAPPSARPPLPSPRPLWTAPLPPRLVCVWVCVCVFVRLGFILLRLYLNLVIACWGQPCLVWTTLRGKMHLNLHVCFYVMWCMCVLCIFLFLCLSWQFTVKSVLALCLVALDLVYLSKHCIHFT